MRNKDERPQVLHPQTPPPEPSLPLEEARPRARSVELGQRTWAVGFVLAASINESSDFRPKVLNDYFDIQGTADEKKWEHCPYHYYKDRGAVKIKDDRPGVEVDYSCGSQCSRKSENIHYSYIK